MKPYEIFKKATEFGIMPEAALEMRMRFLRERIEYYKQDNESDPDVLAVWILQDVMEHVKLKKLWMEERRKQKDEITDEMIERARSTPVETVIEFIRGKTRCINPDHADKHPSAYYGSRNNVLVCPVCDKKWDAIACYQYAHGSDFKSAVEALQ